MKISIITVCYNNEDVIEKCIRSVISQSYHDIEYIVIDGGSTDSTKDIISKYSDYISKIVSEPDKGIYDAMNKGILIATGQIIGTLNSDDMFYDEFIVERIAAEFENDTINVLYGDIITFKEKGESEQILRRYDSSVFSPARIEYGFMPAHPSLYIKRDIFSKLGLYNTSYKIAGDFEFILRLFLNGETRSKYVNDIFVKMRTGGISNQKFKNIFVINKEILRACRQNNTPTNLFKIFLRYPIKFIISFGSKR